MRTEKITYIKRCLNVKCEKRTVCEHGKAQIRFFQHFPEGLEGIPYYMLKEFKAIYPVRNCRRWKMSRQELLELQTSQTK